MTDTYIERLSKWNLLKHQLESDPEPYWMLMRYYDNVDVRDRQTDPWDQSTWPDPWVLIQENVYDSFLISLSMVYSLSLVQRWENTPIELWIVIDYDTGDYYYPVVVENHVLNWNGVVMTRDQIPDTAVIETVYVVERDPGCNYEESGKCGSKIIRKVV